MKKFLPLLLIIIASTQTSIALENSTCKKCHPIIFSEYQNSMHNKASIFKDPVHKAVWDKHPAKSKGDYRCAKCHTPSDHDLIAGKSKLIENTIQQTEPISCQACHKIKNIEKHTKANKNIYSQKDKYFFSADKEKKGTKVVFKEESHLFGLYKTKVGSPYHDIDYSNEIFYNGDLCMGCHSHKQNSHGFAVCDMEIKQGDSKESCISCHMPKVKGSLANQKQSSTHAFHGHNIHNNKGIKSLSKYIKLSLEKQSSGFIVSIENEATHTLFPQPLRLNQLRVSIERGGKTIPLKSISFTKIIGKEGKATPPWIANAVLKNTLIKALETRRVTYSETILPGDTVVVEFGYYIVNPEMAKKLEITDKSVTSFIVLTKERVKI